MAEYIRTDGRKLVSIRSKRLGVAFILVAATSVALSAAAISRSSDIDGLDTGDLATLIYKYQLIHCATTEVMVRSARVGSAPFVAADAWLRRKLLEDPAFVHLGESAAGLTRSGALGYLRDGYEMVVEWRDFRVPGDPAIGRVSLRGCMSLPSNIEVWGTTFYGGGRMAKVMYSESKTGSPLEVLIRGAGVFRADRPWWPSAEGEHVASLRRAADGRWSVTAISDGPS